MQLSTLILGVALACSLQTAAKAEFTLVLSGPSTAVVGTTETLVGSLSSDAPGGLDLSNSTVSLNVLSAPASFSDSTDFTINYPYDYPNSIDPTYNGNLFDLIIDPSTPTGDYDLEFSVDADGTGTTVATDDIEQDLTEGVTGPSAVPEPGTPVTMMVMCAMITFCIVRTRFFSRRAPVR